MKKKVILETSDDDHKKHINEAVNSIVTNLPYDLTIISGENEEIQANKYLLSLFRPTLCPLLFAAVSPHHLPT